MMRISPKISLPDCIRLKNESGTEDVYYSIGCTDLPSEFQVVAEKELNETEETRARGLRKLRQFAKREKLPDFDDFTLIVALRNGKYDIKKSQTKLKKYLRAYETLRSKIEHLDLKKVEMMLDDKGIGILPFRDQHGRIIFFSRPQAMNEEHYSMDEVLLSGVACSMCILSVPLSSVAGLSYIGDCSFATSASFLKLLRAYHEHMWTLITFSGDKIEDLQKVYHPDILPEEFGGNMGPLDPSVYKSIAMDFLRRLKAEGQAMKDASK